MILLALTRLIKSKVMKLIDKDAVVAEIRKRLLPVIRDKHYDEWKEGQNSERIAILGIIDTLEVKEVDLDYIKKELDKVVRIYKPNRDFGWGTLYNVATYFYELGLKAQKGE